MSLNLRFILHDTTLFSFFSQPDWEIYTHCAYVMLSFSPIWPTVIWRRQIGDNMGDQNEYGIRDMLYTTRFTNVTVVYYVF